MLFRPVALLIICSGLCINSATNNNPIELANISTGTSGTSTCLNAATTTNGKIMITDIRHFLDSLLLYFMTTINPMIMYMNDVI